MEDDESNGIVQLKNRSGGEVTVGMAHDETRQNTIINKMVAGSDATTAVVIEVGTLPAMNVTAQLRYQKTNNPSDCYNWTKYESCPEVVASMLTSAVSPSVALDHPFPQFTLD